MTIRITTCLLLSAMLVGCAGTKTPSQKEQASLHWNAARANVMMSLARDQFESGNIDKARQTIDEAMRLNPRSAQIQVMSARLWIERGQLDVAERNLKVAREIDPKNAEADYFSGVVHQRWQQIDKALELYQSSIEKAPAEPAPLLAAAEMLVQLKRVDEAVLLLEQKSVNFENNAIVQDTLGQLLQQQGRIPEAIAVFRRAGMLGVDDPSIREHLALALLESREYHESCDLLLRLMKLPNYQKRSDLLAALGECQLQLGQAREAKLSFETATQFDFSTAGLWLGLAKASLQSGDLARADLSARKAISLDPGSAQPHLVLGYTRLRQERPNDALTEFKAASALDQNDTVSLCMIGFVLEKAGQNEQAMNYYARALRLKPEDALAKQMMAESNN